MNMIKSQGLTSHTYNEDTAAEVVDKIKNVYTKLFTDLKEKFEFIQAQE